MKKEVQMNFNRRQKIFVELFKQIGKMFMISVVLLLPILAYAQTGYDLTATSLINRFDATEVSNADFTWSGDSWAGITFTQSGGELAIPNFAVKYANVNMELTNPIDISGNSVVYFEAKSTQNASVQMRMIDSVGGSTHGQFTIDFIGDGEYHAYVVPLVGSWADLSKLVRVNFSRAGLETVSGCDVTFRYLALGIRERYVLDVEQTTGGNVDIDPVGGIYDEGTIVTLTATPSGENEFDGWSGSVIESALEIQVTMNEDLSLTANFSIPDASSGYFVSKEAGASDSNFGTKESPFLTIQKAASVAQAGDTVFVREGVYRETITPQNSGAAFNPIVYMPYQDEEVTISGADPITGWENHEGNIYKAPMASDFFVSAVNMTDQVFVDGQMMNLARWPNTSLDLSHPVKAQTNKFISKTTEGNITTGVMEDDDLPGTDFVGAEIYFQPDINSWSWAFSGKLTDVTGSQFTFETFSDNGEGLEKIRYDSQSRYYFFNKYSLLDTEGEWFHDTQNNTLYLWLPEDANPENHQIEAKKRDYGFNLSKLSYIEIKGFRIFACNITTDDASGGDGKGYTEDGTVRYPWRGSSSLAESHHVIIDGIECLFPSHSTDISGHFFFQYGGHSGIVLSGEDHVIKNSIIRFSFANAISLLGNRHKILNNLIEDIAYSGCEYGAIGQSGAFAWDCEMAYNTIRRTGRSGIRLGFRNSDPDNIVARVHHNEISDFMLQDWDGGGIYHGGDGGFLRIDHNVIHDGKGYIVSGIYPDFGKNYVYDHNVIYNVWAAFQFTHSESGAGFNNFVIYNNTTVVTNNDGFSSGPFSFVVSGEQNGSYMRNNIGWVYTPPTAPNYKYWSDAATFENVTKSNNLYDQDPMLVEYPFNFQLQSTSSAIDAGVPMEEVTIDGHVIPAFNDPVVGTMDIGAYEFGATPFTVGSSLDEGNSGSVIEIYAAGETGFEGIILMINDNPVAVFDSIKGDVNTGDFEKYEFTANGEIQPEMVKLWFGDHATGRELRIDKIVIDGVEYETEDVINSCTSENTEYLNCSGYLHYQPKPQYTITIFSENGTVELNPPGGVYNLDTELTLTAIPDDGYEFTNWSGDASGSGSPKTITVKKDRQITANFSPVSQINSKGFNSQSVVLYPNPVEDNSFFVQLDNSWQGNITLMVCDAMGRVCDVKQIRIHEGENSISFSDNSALKPGVYIVNIKSERKTIHRSLIVK